MADTGRGPREQKLIRTLGADVPTVLQDIQRVGVRRTFNRSFTDLQQFYLDTHRRDRLATMGRVKRSLYLVFWLLKALFLKLTPPRRLLLLLAFLLLWQGRIQVNFGDARVTFGVTALAVAVLLLILMLELKDKLLARSELEAGRVVQLALMPDRPPRLPGWDIWLFTKSANDVGGDLVDYLQMGASRLGVALGDVAGKGLPAALLMAKLQATLRALASDCRSLGDLGARMNRILNRDGLPDRFATLVYLELAPGSGHIRLVNAGHMPPLLVRPNTIDELPRGSIALGIVPEADFDEQQVDLRPGEMLVVYSDGVTEAMNTAGDFFGDARLRAAVSVADVCTAEETGKRVLAAAEAFTGEAPVYDDLSLVVLKRLA